MSNTINDMNALLAKMQTMSLEAQGGAPGAGGVAASGVSADKPDFSALLKQSIDSVNATQKNAAALSKSFELGDPSVQLAQVMVAMQKASVSFQAMTQVRNKLVSAYKDIMNMPI